MLNTLNVRVGAVVLLGVFVLGGTGCKTLVLNAMQQAPIENRFHLHPGYKVGDYALFEAMGGKQHMKMEIVGVQRGQVEIKLSWPKVPPYVGFLRYLSYHVFVDEKGHVLRAHAYDAKTGRSYPLKVAEPGDHNYIGDVKEMVLNREEAITTKAGTFRIKNVIVFNQFLQNFAISSLVTTTMFVDADVKFGLVRRIDVMESHLPLIDLCQHIVKFSPLPGVAKSLYGFILEKAKDPKHYWEMNLVETN